jgi:hypothetical protein
MTISEALLVVGIGARMAFAFAVGHGLVEVGARIAVVQMRGRALSARPGTRPQAAPTSWRPSVRRHPRRRARRATRLLAPPTFALRFDVLPEDQPAPSA